MRKMLVLPVPRLFVDKISGNPISRSKYTSMMHKEMQKMGIPAFFTAYSLKHAAIEKLVRLKMELHSGALYTSYMHICFLFFYYECQMAGLKKCRVYIFIILV
jgi:hypothetical protein